MTNRAVLWGGWCAGVLLSIPGWGMEFGVYEKGTGRPLKRVEVKTQGKTYTSDGGGVVHIPEADLELLRQGAQGGDMSKSGFETQRFQASLWAEPPQKVYMTPKLLDQDDVVVMGKRRSEVSKKTITMAEAASVAPGGDPLKVAQLLPGVQTGGFGSQLIIRGSGPEDTRYYLDQVELPFVLHSVGDISVVPDRMLQQIDFSTGGFGPQYGKATGGAVVLRSKNTLVEAPLTELRLNVPLYTSFYHERPLGEGAAFYGSARYSLLEWVIPPLLKNAPGVDKELTILPFFGDVNLEYITKPSESTTYKVRYLQSQDGIKAAFPDFDAATADTPKASLDIKTGFHNLSVMGEHRINKTYSYTSTPNVLWLYQHFNFLDNRLDVDVKTFSLPFELTQRRAAQQKDCFGFEYEFVHYDVDIYAIQPPRDDPFYDYEAAERIRQKASGYGHNYALWTSTEWTLGGWSLTPGVRYDYMSFIDKAALDPRITAHYALHDAHTLKASLGRYSQPPANDQADPKFGNPDLGFKHATHYVLGLDSQWSEYWNTDVQLFYKAFSDMIHTDAELRYANKGTGYARGFELFLRRNLTSKLFGWVSYTYARSRLRSDPKTSEVFSLYDQTHMLSVVGDYKLSATLACGGRLQYNTGTPYTPVEEGIYQTAFDKYQPRFRQDKLFSERLPPLTKMSAYVSMDSLYNEWKLKWRLGVEDLILGTDARNVRYNYDYSETKYVRSIPAIPYVEVRAVL